MMTPTRYVADLTFHEIILYEDVQIYMIMKYNKEQNINTHSTITTYILKHSCYSFGSLCIRA
jgi:hypothetical protein